MSLCFAKCEQLSFFWGHFFGKFWLKFEKRYKIGISALFKKQKNGKKMTIFKVNNWAKLKSITGPSWGSKKKAQLGPVIDSENLHALF